MIFYIMKEPSGELLKELDVLDKYEAREFFNKFKISHPILSNEKFILRDKMQNLLSIFENKSKNNTTEWSYYD